MADVLQSTQVGSGSTPDILGRRSFDNSLTALKASFSTEILDFTSLKGSTAKEILSNRSNQSKLIQDLRKLCLLTQSAMLQMNREQPGLPPDSIDRTLELVTQSGAKVVVLKGCLNSRRQQEPEVLGYGIVMLGRENIIDAYHIPDSLLQKEDACRVIRLFVTNAAREYLPRGEAFSKIIDQIKIMAKDGLLIGMILTGMESSANEKIDAGIWLDAMNALAARGFEKTGYGLIEEIKDLKILFEWWTWSRNSSATETQERFTKRIADLEHYKIERLAPLVPAIPLSSALISIHGRATHGYDLAQAYPGNLIIAPEYKAEARAESAHNLIKTSVNSTGEHVDPNTLDASIIMGALPDIINLNQGQDPKTSFKKFVETQFQQLKDSGSLVIRDSIAPEEDKLIEIRLAPKEAQLWKSFIDSKTEKHISQDQWNSIKAIKSENTDKEAWIAPLSVCMEFMNKSPHASPEESQRCYTTLSAQDRIEILESAGFRIVYDSPVESKLYQNRNFAGKIDLYDLQGHQLKYPALVQVTIAEKISKNQASGIKFEIEQIITDSKFLNVSCFERLDQNGRVLGIQEIITRNSKREAKLVSLDVLPYFLREEFGTKHLYFGARVTPRPLIALTKKDASYLNIFHVEQIGAISSQEILDSSDTISNASKSILSDRAGISPRQVLSLSKPSQGYTRPDAIDELVLMQSAKTEESYWEGTIDNPIYSFSTRPSMKTFEASRYLQGCQSGIFRDRRLELMLYQALIENKAEHGSWLGEKPNLIEQRIFKARGLAEVLAEARSNTIHYKKSSMPMKPQFLQVRKAKFNEVTKASAVIGTAELEYVRTDPSQKLADNALSVLTVSKMDDEIYVGLEIRDFLAAYLHSGKSKLLTLPTLRMPAEISDFDQAARWTQRRLKDYFGVEAKVPEKMGGEYFTSPGCTSETIQPTICEVDQSKSADNTLSWIKLSELLEHSPEIECLQLRTAVYRAAHMFGLIN
jgi:hypothetical protein